MKTRRGSALLIVLGMMAFMVISAVAFSAYMRYSRLPSSFLRQTVSSRLLVKAALSEAIDEIDAAIGNNPHPGVGNHSYDYPRQSTQTQFARNLNRNKWIGRVYIGATNTSQSALSPSQCLIDPNETVSPLCLEALAHIPTPLVNEVRYYSRRSTAGKWHPMPYDAGRYSFCAVDVSDYFDVNALAADRPRSSFAPDRLSLAYLWEDWGESGNDGLVKLPGTPANWDSFMDTFIGDGKLPLVSVADLNLAIDYAKPGGLESPFGTYARNGGDTFYCGIGDQNSEKANQYRRMTFVTDGWFPPTNVVETAKKGDLNEHQPFTDITNDRTDSNITAVRTIFAYNSSSSGPLSVLKDNFSGLDLVSLWDYLDENDVPCSLALPTVERVPMIAGLQPVIQLEMEIVYEMGVENTLPSPPGTYKYERDDSFRLKITAVSGTIGALCAYPFVRDANLMPMPSCNVDFSLSLGFADSTAGEPRMRVDSSCGMALTGVGDFSSPNGAIVPGKGVVKMSVKTTSPPSFSTVRSASDAFCEVNSAPPNLSAVIGSTASTPAGVLFTVKHQYEREPPPPGSTTPGPGPIIPGSETIISVNDVSSDLMPLNNQFAPHPSWSAAAIATTPITGLKPYLAVAARVTKNDKTVDLAPASVFDDGSLNNVTPIAPSIGNINGGSGQYPLLLFADASGANPFDIDAGNLIQWLDTTFGVPVGGAPGPHVHDTLMFTIKPASGVSIFCPDPRWNFAPENFAQANEPLSAIKGWYTDNRCGLGVAGRDKDPFMAVSNQGFMQSPAEMAFIARTLDPEYFARADAATGNLKLAPSAAMAQSDFVVASGSAPLDNLLHGANMWRTYRLYDMVNSGDKYLRDDVYDCLDQGKAFTWVNGGTGYKVNPYTDSLNILMSVIANTPDSWAAAGMNHPDNQSKYKGKFNDANGFNKNCAFGPDNGEATIEDTDLLEIARNIRTAFRPDTGNQDDLRWEDVFDNLDWGAVSQGLERKQFLGEARQRELYEIDRKTLFGFWRECFDVRQQLFLIFVRAEPMMMGGGSSTQTPPQLGAKAVALVWRDPAPTAQNNAPHKTRILFYRQFD